MAQAVSDAAALPPAISLSPRPAILGGCLVIAVMAAAMFGWAGTAPLASAVVAQGVVMVEGSRKQVQHLEGGLVDKILVRDGDQVMAGQLLLRLDEARARASLGILQTASDSARALEARLRAERDGTPLRFPDDMAARRKPTLNGHDAGARSAVRSAAGIPGRAAIHPAPAHRPE